MASKIEGFNWEEQERKNYEEYMRESVTYSDDVRVQSVPLSVIKAFAEVNNKPRGEECRKEDIGY